MKTKILNIFAGGKRVIARCQQALSRGQQAIVRNRRTFMLAVLLVAVAFLVVPHLALAADPPSSNPDLDEMYKNITKLVTFTMEFLQRLIWPVLLLIGGLLKTDILFGSGMEDRMLAIWVQIRNLVNILFVLVLLGIAFYNVVGGSNQAYQLKGMLPKFVIGLIAVNFSFIGVKLLIDTVNVLTTAVFALPASVQEGLGKNPVDDLSFVRPICEGIYGGDDVYQKNILDAEAKKKGSTLCDEAKAFRKDAKSFFANFDANNAGIIMAISLSKINDWGKVPDGAKGFKDLAMSTVFSVTLFIVFATAFVALFVVLLVRLVVLWVTLVLSPLIVLTYVLPEGISSSVGGGDLKKKFVKNIIAPLPIALMMTIGFLMLQGMKTAKFTSLSALTMDVSSISIGMFASGLSTLQELIIAVGTIAVIWMGVFEAANGTYADGIVKSIKSGVEGVGKFAATSFKYAPMFPVSGATGKDGKPLKMSLAGAMNMPGMMQQGRDDAARQETNAAMDHFGFARSKHADAFRSAKDDKQYWQKGKNAEAAGVVDTPGVQKEMHAGAVRLGLNNQTRMKIPISMTDAQGKKIENFKDLMTNMQNGTVSATTMKDIIRLNGPEKAESKEVQDAAADSAKKGGATTKDAHAKAKNALDMAGTNEQLLTPPQKTAAGNYRAAMAGKDEKKKEAALKALQDSGAVGAISGLEKDRNDFKTKADLAKDGPALDAVIAARRNELNKGGATTPAAQNEILHTELEGVFKKNSEAVQKSAEINGSPTAPGIIQARPATTPSPVAPYVEPEAGKAKGGGGPNPSNIKLGNHTNFNNNKIVPPTQTPPPIITIPKQNGPFPSKF